ncbi:MAG: hypothetical protein AB7P25_13275 [Dehalococcoidia bacterium]
MRRAVVGLGALGVAALAVVTAMAASTVTDRGLPDSNLNNAAGASRSNVSWSFGNTWMTGDDFTVGAAGEKWIVTSVTTWQTAGAPGAIAFGDRYADASLFGGPANPGGVALIATGSLSAGSNVNSNANITHTPVAYANLAEPNYQGSSGSQIQLWETKFSGIAWAVDGGVKNNFSVDGTVRPAVSYLWFNHASNAALSGTPQQGADGFFLGWDKSDLSAPPFACDSGDAINCGGWDKSSDINVVVTAVQIATNADACKKDGWKTLVRANGTSFKNQGDCVSYTKNGK